MNLLLRFWRKALRRGTGSNTALTGIKAVTKYPSHPALPMGPLEKYQLGLKLVGSRQYAKARGLIEELVAHDPEFIDGLNALANIARFEGDSERAQRLYHDAIELQPTNAVIWSNLGLCLREAGRVDEALVVLRHALTLCSDSAPSLVNLAVALSDKGAFTEARTLLERSLEIEPDFPEAHTALAHLMLQDADFSGGWREYAWRFRCADADNSPEYPIPVWTGEAIQSRVLLVRAEQGLGDQLMFASCLPDVIARARVCLVECDRRLVNLFARSFAGALFFPSHTGGAPQWQDSDISPDFQTYLGALPGLFRQRAEDFQRGGAYLCADPERARYWRGRLDELGPELKVGISWRGGAPRTRGASRSVPLTQWLPILRQKNAVFVSLQYGRCADEIDDINKVEHVYVHHWPNAIDNYDETAALVSVLDLVISVQTAVIHLAGALGTRAWVLVPAVAEWRYLVAGKTMPWYPTVSLFRQKVQGEWDSVVDEAAAALAVHL